jgi:hypothetical protein
LNSKWIEPFEKNERNPATEVAIMPESPLSFKLRERENRSRVYHYIEKAPHAKDGRGNRLPLAMQREIAHQIIIPLQRASPHARRCFLAAHEKNKRNRSPLVPLKEKVARKTSITWADTVEVKEVDYGAVISPSGKTEQTDKKEHWREVKANISQAYFDMKNMHI